MSWEKRGGRRYYYSAKRVDGRVVKRYKGEGESAQRLAQIMEQKQAAHSKALAFLRAWERDDTQYAEEHQQALTLARLYLEAQGYHRPRRWKWRKKMATTSTMKAADTTNTGELVTAWKVPEDRKARYALIDAGITRGATPEQQEQARACMKAHPEDVPKLTRFRPIESLASGCPNRAALDCKEIQVEQYAAELAGPNASPIVLAMARQVVADLLYINTQRYLLQRRLDDPDKGVPIKFLPLYDKPVEIAHRRYLASSKTLAELKRLALPSVNVAMPGSVQVNAEINQINSLIITKSEQI